MLPLPARTGCLLRNLFALFWGELGGTGLAAHIAAKTPQGNGSRVLLFLFGNYPVGSLAGSLGEYACGDLVYIPGWFFA